MEIPYVLLIFLTYPLEFPQICFKIWTLTWKFLHFLFTFSGGHWKFHMSSIGGGVRINNATSQYTAITIKVVHEQSVKVEYERERQLGIAFKLINLLAIPSSLSRSYSTFRFARGQP
jgi:hypothetical protein